IIRRSYSDFKDLHSQLTRSVQPPDDDAVDWPSSYRLICRCCVTAFSSFSSSSSSSAQLKMALDGGVPSLEQVVLVHGLRLVLGLTYGPQRCVEARAQPSASLWMGDCCSTCAAAKYQSGRRSAARNDWLRHLPGGLKSP
ncbi:hypothetical protein PR002_g33238, partial [Phytophthora rubi]